MRHAAASAPWATSRNRQKLLLASLSPGLCSSPSFTSDLKGREGYFCNLLEAEAPGQTTGLSNVQPLL